MDILYEFVKFNVKWQRAGFIDPGATRKLDEIVDIFDIRGGATGRTMLRGSAQPYGDYFRAVQVWFIGSDGSVLLQRRSMRCAFTPGYFAVTGGVPRGAGPDDRRAQHVLSMRLHRQMLPLHGLCSQPGRTKRRTEPTKRRGSLSRIRKRRHAERLLRCRQLPAAALHAYGYKCYAGYGTGETWVGMNERGDVFFLL